MEKKKIYLVMYDPGDYHPQDIPVEAWEFKDNAEERAEILNGGARASESYSVLKMEVDKR